MAEPDQATPGAARAQIAASCQLGAELLIGQGAWLRRGDFTGPFIVVAPGLAGLAATFGLDPGTAVRYASSARQLL